jgi:hypothetical protein
MKKGKGKVATARATMAQAYWCTVSAPRGGNRST